MANTYIPPAISTAYDLDADQHVLIATSHSRSAIAGERILRAEPWPQIRWSSPSQEEAEKEAVKLRAYLAECASGKRKEKEHVPRARGWWED